MKTLWRLNASALTIGLLMILGPVRLAYSQLRPLYEVIDLSPPGATRPSYAYAVNNLDQVVGKMHGAFLWEDGEMMELGASVYAYSINNAGQVVGRHQANGDRAFIWERDGGLRTLGGATVKYSAAYAINDSGQVAGAFREVGGGAPSFGSIACLWDTTDGISLTPLGTLGGDTSYAFGINNYGQVVGRSDADYGTHAFLWDPVEGMRDLGTLGGYAQAEAINDDGCVVGWAYAGREKYAFIWTEGEGMISLGALGGTMSEAFAINNVGQVVGWAHTPNSKHAFLWDEHTGMVDLNTLMAPGSNFSLLDEAWGINDLGHIVGFGHTLDGEIHAFLMIPEPATLLLLGFGVLGLLRRSRQV